MNFSFLFGEMLMMVDNDALTNLTRHQNYDRLMKATCFLVVYNSKRAIMALRFKYNSRKSDCLV